MVVQQHVLNWLYSVLTSEYSNVNRTYNDVAQVLSQYPSLSPRTDVHTFPNGTSALLLHLTGTIPVVFRGTTYRFPISLWIPYAYPREAPLVYVTPTETMVVRPGQHVDAQGQVYHPYLLGWAGFWDKSTILDFLTILRDVFAKEPPVIARAQGRQPPPAQEQTPTPPPVPPLPPGMAPRVTSPVEHHIREAPARPPLPPKPGAHAEPSHSQSHSQPQGHPQSTGPHLPPHPPQKPTSYSHPEDSRTPPGQHQPRPESWRYSQPPPLAPPQGHSNPHLQHSGPLPPQAQGPPHGAPPHGGPPQQWSPPPAQAGPPQQPPQPAYAPNDPRNPTAFTHPQPYPVGQPNPGSRYPPAWHQQQTPAHQQQHPAHQQYAPAQPPSQPKPAPPPAPNLLDEDLTLPIPSPSTTSVPAPPIPPNPEKDLLLHQLAHTLHDLRQRARAQNDASLAGLESQRAAMRAAAAALQAESAQLGQLSALLASNTAVLQESLRRADGVVERSARQPEPDVDDLLVAPHVVGNQLYDLVAEERALADAIFVLGRAVERGRVAPQTFAKMTRSLAREWYLKKALVKKIGEGMGLAQ
ncbi:UEV domain-containing protein [Schizothecium vesticola]|uniref:UEV domain-containing protein n=1 Tax=Schizothecium vesticola TaxID=314040 RepID=A0AA40F4K7_9PEZI|nr:UEV domain-containing protein [Schizothecium vesticola]